MRRMIGNLAALATAGVVSFGVGEAALRAVVTLPLRRIDPEVRYLPHPNRRFTLQPRQSAFTYGAPITVDDHGFRANGQASQRTEAGATVLALGDSFTFGLGVKDDETWPARLEQRLVEAGLERVRVINAGTISYGTFQQMDLLKEHGLDRRPQVVVHGLYWNDFMNDGPPGPDDPRPLTSDGYFIWDRPPDTRSPLQKGASWLFSRSALLFAARQAASQVISAEGGAGGYSDAYQRMLHGGLLPEEWLPIENFYRQLRAIGDQQGFSTLVVIMPVIDIVSQAEGDQHPYAVEARKRLTALGLPFVDAFQMWSGDQETRDAFLPQGPDAHLNAEGYRRLARELANVMMTTPGIRTRLQR